MRLSRPKPDLGRHRRLSDAADRPVSNMSYYSRRSEDVLNTGRNQPRPGPKRSSNAFFRFWIHRFGLAVLLVVAVICLVDVLSLSSNPVIVPVSAGAGSFLHQTSTYQVAASALLRQSIWNRNKLTADTGQLIRQLQRQFPELTSVSVTLPLLAHRPVIYIEPSQPVLVIVNTGGSYVLGANGKALAVAGSSLSVQNLPVVVDQSGLRLALNQQALTSSSVSFIQTVVAQLAARHVGISSLTLPAAASELDAHVSGEPYFIKFNLQSGDARQQAGTFLAVRNRLTEQGITPAQYIDVRVDGRAYYK